VSVTVYVASGCPFSARLLADLRRRAVAHECIDLTASPERAAEVVALTWDRRVPVVVDHERFTVGFAGGSSTFEELGIDPASTGR
jgi:glutaredoxin